MMVRFLAAVCLGLAGLAALAQTPAAFVGTWRVSWQGEKRPQEARMVLSESGGTWKTATSSQSNNCVGREVPVVIEKATDTDAQLRLKFSEMAGCSDALVTLRKVDDKTLTGLRGKAELTAVRD